MLKFDKLALFMWLALLIGFGFEAFQAVGSPAGTFSRTEARPFNKNLLVVSGLADAGASDLRSRRRQELSLLLEQETTPETR